MNDFSFLLIMLFGALFGFLFQDLLTEAGLDKRYRSSPISVLILPFFAFIGFILYPVLSYGVMQFAEGEFYGTVFFWLAVSLLIGGVVRYAVTYALEYEKKPQPEAAS
jgi:hypothetical protein